MAQNVKLPDGQIVSFPDDVSADEIDSTLNRDFPQFAPKRHAEDGILGTLGGGAAQTWRAGGAALDLAQNDLPELQAAAAAQAARVKDPRLAAFEADLAQRRERLGKDPGWLDVIGQVGSAAWKNPAGAGLMTIDQLPNSAAVLAGAGAGAALGSAVGPAGSAVGGIIGGLGGMFAGNFAVEGGNRALEHVAKTGTMSSEDRGRLLYEGAIKAGVITGVDAATFGMTKYITNTARRAAETAAVRVAETAGVPVAEIAARRAADPAFDSAVMAAQKLAVEGANKFGTRALQTGAALGLETIGEGLGEYLGEFAATGEADKMDAVIEAFSSLGQSAAEVGIAKVWNSRNLIAPIAAAKAPDDAIAAADAALSAPIDTLSSTIDAFKSEWADEKARIPADSAIPMIGMPEPQVVAQPLALPTDGSPTGQPIEVPRAPPGPALLALAEQLATLSPAEQTKALMRLDAPMRQAVVRAMQPSGIVTPDTVAPPGMGEAARITNEATMAASSVQPVGDATVTNVPALTQRAAQEIVSKTPGMEMRPHREVAGRFEVVPVASAAGEARGVFSTGAVPTMQQILADEESVATAAPAAPAVRPVTPSVPLTAEQLAANQAAADAERSSLPRRTMFRDSQLRSESGPDIKGERVTRNMRRVLVQLARLTGTKVVFEYAPNDAEGAVPNRTENVVHINTAARINPLQVLGHEVTHVLRDRHGKAWSSVRDALVATMTDKRAALDAFASDYWGVGEANLAKLAAARAMPDWSAKLTAEQKAQFGTSENTVEAFLLDEMVSDLGGQHWSDEKFWLDVFTKIEAKEGAKAKGIIERLVISIREMLTKMIAVIRAQGQGDYVTVSPEQLEKTRDAVASAYAEFIRAERRTEPDGEPHVTDHRIGTSDTHSRSSGAEGEPAREAAVPVPPVVGDSEDELSDARARELASLSTQRLFFEAAPNPDDKAAVTEWKKAGKFGRERIDKRVREVIVPGLLKDLRITGEIVPQLGGWMDATNPSFALVVRRGDPALAARAIGHVLEQQAMYALGLERFTGAERTGIIRFDIAGKDAHEIYMKVRALDTERILGHSTVGNEMFIGLPLARMEALRNDVVTIARAADIEVSFDKGYGATIKDYGYAIQGERQNSRQQRPETRDVDRWYREARALRSVAAGGRPDAAGSGSNRTGVARKSTERPSYGEGSGEQVVGVHYSREQRPVLSSRFFGTGMKAQERVRLGYPDVDPRIKLRLYFYANTGKGIHPESDVGYHAHSVTLNNVYDMDVDPKKLWQPTRDGEPYRSDDALMNDFESRVIDAGYDGYMTREFGQGGAVVLLGDHRVPVLYEGERARPDTDVMPAPKFSDEQALRRKLIADNSLPSGQLTGLEWMRLFLKRGTDFVPRWLDKDKLYYRDQLIPQVESARMSTQRASPWWYSPLARAADSATMKKAPASGWKSWLKSLAAKGVKPDEIKWSGIEEWLDVQGEAVVTKEQVQAYLSEFGVRIETIVRGEISPVTDTEQDVDDEDVDIELNVGDWQTDEPNEYWLADRASERFDEEVDEKVEAEWEDIADDIQREARTRIEVSLPDLAAEIRRAMGDMFPVDDELVEQTARNIAAAQVAGDTWQEYADSDADLTDERVQIEATDRAFAVLSGDAAALETEARRRVRAEIDDDKLLDKLVEQERQWYFDDYESPQTRQITVDGVDGYFYDSTSYGDRNLYYNGHDIPLPRRADDADVEGAIRQYVMEEGLVAGGRGGEFRATKWDGYTTDNRRAVPGSYREVQLTLPVDAFGLPTTHPVTGHTDRTPVKDFYYTTHWSEANVIGHARFDEHIDGDGKRVLVLQEVQGDWGQQRREGLEAQAEVERLEPIARAARERVELLSKQLSDALPEMRASDLERLANRGVELSESAPDEARDILQKLRDARVDRAAADEHLRRADRSVQDTPDAAPFIEKTPQWAGLVLKRMIAHAVENGFDKVVWTSGAQQVERWRSSLRKEVDTIAWEKTEEGIHITASQNGRVRTDTSISETALSDAIGKQMAKQIIADPNQSGEITGNDITISDTGMAGFYDRMLPNIANDILRKFDKDVRVKDIEVHKVRQYSVAPDPDTAGRWIVQQDGKELVSHPTKERAELNVESLTAGKAAIEIGVQQGFEITDKLRESAANGMPLFSQRRASAEARKSNARKEWYRSQLSEAVGGLPAKIRTGKEAAIWLQANSAKLGVKKDELTWSGVLDWLATQRSVTGAQIQDWLASNGVRVKDVMLGEESEEYRRLDAELQAMDGEIDRLRKAARDDNVPPQNLGDIPKIARLAAKNNPAASEHLMRLGVPKEKLNAVIAYGRALNRKNELFERRAAARGERPQYDRENLMLPGGSEYRELLLTLPGESELKVVEHPSKKGFALQYSNGAYVTSPDGGTTTEQTFDADKASLWDKKEYVSEGLKAHDKTQFRGSHYKQPNILAHVRFNERTDADGKRVLFIEEVQSDWAQQGRKEGFKGAERTAYQVVVDGNPAGAYESMAEAEAAKQRALKYNAPEKVEIRPVRGKVQDIKGVPAAPFVTDTKAWVALALKRAISHAVDNGFDRVAWTTGEQQAERYDLSKQVSYVRAIRNSDDTYWVMAVQSRETGNGTGDILFDKDKLTAAELEDTIGKDLTAKIVKQEKRKEHEYTGLDLKVGGEGMVAFYDGIVKQVARSLGATVGTVRVSTGADVGTQKWTVRFADGSTHNSSWTEKSIAEQIARKEDGDTVVPAGQTGSAQPGFDITDKMREQARVGMPLFSQRRVHTHLVMHEGRLDQLLRANAIRHDPKMTKNYVAWMDPRAFVNATTPASDYDRLKQESRPLDAEKLKAETQPLFLDVTDDLRNIIGHEGRHRALALIEAGVRRVPVVLFVRNIGWSALEPIAGPMVLRPQNYGGGHSGMEVAVARDLIPLSYANRDALKAEFIDKPLLDAKLFRADPIRFSEQRRTTPALDQWLGRSVVRTVMYHGTARDITTFRPQQADAIFLTDDPEFAANFADMSHSWMVNNYWTWMSPDQIQQAKRDAMRMLLQDALPGSSLYMREERLLNQSQFVSQYMRRAVEQYMPSESNIMPLYVRAENPFDYRNPEHVAAIEREIGTSWMGYENIHGAVAEVAQHIGDLERGDWNAIESEPVQRYIRANHDSFYVRERGVTNLAVFSPNQVKSASGNDGSYSREDNDIRRSEMRPNTENLDTALRRMDKFVTAFEAKQVKASDVQVLGPTPTVLQALGAEPLNIAIDGHTINKVLVDQNKHAHLITAAMLRDLPRGLYDPLMIFDSPDPKTGLPGKLFVTEIDDRRKNPIVGAVHLSKQGARMVINEITSYYGLENFMTREKTSPSRLEYIRNDEALDLSTTLRSLNLSLVVQKARELGRNIQTEQDIVNQYGNRYSTPRSRLNGQPINQSWPDPDMTDWDDFVRKMQDKMVDTKRIVKAIREAGVAIAEKFDPYMQEILYHGRAASRVKNFADTELRQLLEDMSHRGVVMQDLDDYLWARHAPERNAANARSNPAITDGSGMTDAQAADILAGRAVTINGRTIQLSQQTLRGAAALATRVDAITNRTLDLLVEYKLETQATIDTWKRTYAHYAPLKRDMESDANYSGAFNLGLGTGKGFDIRGAASRRALGSKRSVVDILANVAMQRERAIVRGEKNRVAQAVYGLALTAPNPEFWIPVNPALNKGLSPAALAKLQAELVSIGVNPLDAQNIAREPVERYIDPNTGLEATRINPRLRNRDDVLSVRINGEDRYVMFSNKERAQRMVAGLKNLDADQLGAFLQTAAIGTRWFASVNTQFNPIFGITNGLRDLSTGMLNLSSTPLSANRAEIARNAFSALKGIYLDLRDHRAGRQPTSQWAQLFEQFALDGGQTGYRDMFQNSKARADEIAKELKHAGKGKQWVTGGEKHSAVFGWLSDYNTAVENAVRLSAYKAALDRGMTREAAAALAKNLTVNFNKKGLAATQTGALYAFFNAAVQGTARIAETMEHGKKPADHLGPMGQKIVYGGIVLGVMQATLGMLAGWDDEEPPQYLREKNFLIPIPGGDKYLSIPMPLGFHVIPSVGRIATEWMMSGFKDPGKRLTRLAGVLLDAFNPIGGTGSIGQMLSPTITDPIIALGENKDWTGKPIYKEDFNKMQPTPGWTRAKDVASPISRWLSYAMNYATGGGKYEIGLLSPTPDQIDYLVGQATGGVGREILKTAQYVGAKATGEELPLYKTPLGVGRFVGETKGQASETSRFYDNLRRIGEHKSALEEMKDARDGDALLRYLERHPDARLVQTADKAQREIGYLRRQKRELIEKGASKERVKMIEDKITGLTRRYNEVLAAKK